MKVAAYLIVFSLVIAAVCAAAFEEVEDTDLQVQDFLDYFEAQNQMAMMEKRRPKVGPCRSPTGASCQVCNLKITNKKNMKRYLVCGGGTTGI